MLICSGKTIGIRSSKNIFVHAVHHRYTAPANGPECAILTAAGPLSILPGTFAFINLQQAAFKDVADGGVEFTADIHPAVGKQGDEIKGGPASETGAPTEKALAAILQLDQVEKIVLMPMIGRFANRKQCLQFFFVRWDCREWRLQNPFRPQPRKAP